MPLDDAVRPDLAATLSSPQVAEIVEQLEALYDAMICCLQKDPASHFPPRTISALLDQQRRLLSALEQAIGAALAHGASPQQLDAVITDIEKAHQRCQQLLRRHIAELEQTMVTLSKRQQHRAAYLAHCSSKQKFNPPT